MKDFDRYDDPPSPSWDDGEGRPPAWSDAGPELVAENPWMTLTVHDAVAPTGTSARYMVLHPANLAVGVLPIHEDGTVVLVGQQRFALKNYSWEMPEGGAPFDEAPLEGVKRELAEEAGLVAAHWEPALKLELSNSITDERAMTWIAWDLSATETAPDETEVIAVRRVPFRDLLAEIERGAVRDVMTVATAYKAYHMAREGELPAALARAMLG